MLVSLSKYWPGSRKLQVKVPSPLGFSSGTLPPKGSVLSHFQTACPTWFVMSLGVFSCRDYYPAALATATNTLSIVGTNSEKLALLPL